MIKAGLRAVAPLLPRTCCTSLLVLILHGMECPARPMRCAALTQILHLFGSWTGMMGVAMTACALASCRPRPRQSPVTWGPISNCYMRLPALSRLFGAGLA
jgi:hypothetical protein